MIFLFAGLGAGCLTGGVGSVIAILRWPSADDRMPLCVAGAAALIGAWTLTVLAVAG